LPTRGAGTIYEQTESAVTHNALRKEYGASAAKRLTNYDKNMKNHAVVVHKWSPILFQRKHLFFGIDRIGW
jgi:hypothetical protein